jgi:hypothetical protein
MGGLIVWAVDLGAPCGSGGSINPGSPSASGSGSPSSNTAAASSGQSTPLHSQDPSGISHEPSSGTQAASSQASGSQGSQSTTDARASAPGSKSSGSSQPTSSGPIASYDVSPEPEVWQTPNPTVQCVPPCTFVLPPYTLCEKTTIPWSPLTTTLLKITGGEKSTVTTSYDALVGTTITKVTTVLITIKNCQSSTVTTTISVPAVTTNEIEFWPISVETTDAPRVTFQPVPMVMPQSFSISVSSGLAAFPLSFYPNYAGSTAQQVACLFPTSSETIWIQPMPTQSFSLPGSSMVCPDGTPAPGQSTPTPGQSTPALSQSSGKPPGSKTT